MGKMTGFLEFEREVSAETAPKDRIRNWNEFHTPLNEEERKKQGARCMDCGVPFCQSGIMIKGMVSGCPLNNLIPEWNDLVYTGNWSQAYNRLKKTNSFPEFTSRVCPAPCEAACTCGLNGDPVTVKENEWAIIEKAYDQGVACPNPPSIRTGKKVAVIGSGPAGLAAADQLNKRGHSVTVFERSDRVGGLLMYGIPNMKLEKWVIDRKVDVMKQEGVSFVTGADVGKGYKANRIMKEYDEPTVVALKHMNPCGIGTASTILEAWEAAYEADPVSIFGGIIVLNREVDLPTAEQMHKLFLEIIIAPSYTQEALELLQKKKNIRLLTVDFAQEENQKREETVSVLGGLLVQDQDLAIENEEEWKVVTKRKPNPAEAKALAFAWKAVKHVKSNAIVLANERQTVGIGAGQMNRVGSVKIAIEQAQEKMEGAVLASDAYFPMDDSVEYAAKHGIKAIIQPGGSIKDQDSIDMANKYDLAMVFTDVRHFRH